MTSTLLISLLSYWILLFHSLCLLRVESCCIFCNKMQIISILNDRSNDKWWKWSIQQEKMKIIDYIAARRFSLQKINYFGNWNDFNVIFSSCNLSGFKVCQEILSRFFLILFLWIFLLSLMCLFLSLSLSFVTILVWIVFMFMFRCVSWLVMCDDSFFNNLFMVLHHKDFNRKRQFQI